MFGTRNITFDQHARAFFQSYLIRGLNLLPRIKFNEHAAPVVAVAGFDDNGQADFLGSLPGILRTLDDTTFGTGTPQERNSDFVKSLSREMVSAIAGVR